MKEFNKNTMLIMLNALIQQLITNENFNPLDGWQQVDGKGEAINRAFGQLDAYLALWYNISGDAYPVS